MSEGSDKLLQVILDRSSTENNLIEHVQQLKVRYENSEFWTNIINDETYGAVHRRIAFVQYFVRHSLHKKIVELGLGSLNLSPFAFNISVIGLWTGEMPVHPPVDNAVVRIICPFGKSGSTTIYISIFPKTTDSDLQDSLRGRKTDSRQVVTDVAAAEQLTSGAYISWKKWQQRQIYEHLPPK